MPKNAYIHIPFCRSKCNYCSFTSFVDLELKSDYLKALKKEISSEYKEEKLNTLYFGGGTPSLLTIDEIRNIIDLFDFEKEAEITVEVNPDSVNFDYLKKIHDAGVNRLSIGAQTFNDKILKSIGRRHNAAQIIQAVNFAKEAEFKSISLDFIYGLPSQNLKGFEADLQQAINVDVQHISLYGLKLDEGCYFYKNPPSSLPNLDIQADMYLKVVEILKNSGFKHYEISNFAKCGFESKHNLNYWDNNLYYGFGCAASGYNVFVGQEINDVGQSSNVLKSSTQTPRPLWERVEFQCEERALEIRVRGNFRYTNEPDLQKYIKNPLEKSFEQKLTEQEILEEAIFLGLRKIAGINIKEINEKFGINFEQKYSKILQKYAEYFVKTSDGYAFTLNGILISNEILAEFISD